MNGKTRVITAADDKQCCAAHWPSPLLRESKTDFYSLLAVIASLAIAGAAHSSCCSSSVGADCCVALNYPTVEISLPLPLPLTFFGAKANAKNMQRTLFDRKMLAILNVILRAIYAALHTKRNQQTAISCALSKQRETNIELDKFIFLNVRLNLIIIFTCRAQSATRSRIQRK